MCSTWRTRPCRPSTSACRNVSRDRVSRLKSSRRCGRVRSTPRGPFVDYVVVLLCFSQLTISWSLTVLACEYLLMAIRDPIVPTLCNMLRGETDGFAGPVPEGQTPRINAYRGVNCATLRQRSEWLSSFHEMTSRPVYLGSAQGAYVLRPFPMSPD